jgi:tetratricopeptide (TPR) repeat protein
MSKKSVRNSRLVSFRFAIALSATLGFGCLVSPRAVFSQPKPGTPRQAQALSAQSQRSLELNEQGVSAIKAKDFAKAETLFTEALNVDSRNITAVFNLAGMYITNKKEGQAVSLLQKYTREFPKDAGLHARLGDAYFGSQDPKNAIASYEKALQLDPKNPLIPVRLATLYAMSKKLDKAAQMYEQALKHNPRDTQSLQNLSSIYLALNKPQQAIATAKKALQISTSPDLYVTLGNAYQDLKDPRNALIAFQRAREMGHKDPNLTKVIEDLARATSESSRT